jgi:RES domain-containing protein
MRVWRLTSAAHASFDGEGARLYGSRWTPRGVPVVFTSATLSLAVLERFVHTDSDTDVSDLVAITVEIRDQVLIDAVDLNQLPANWRAFPPPPSLTTTGERWVQSAQTAILSVPSVVIPHERNFIINPRHSEFAKLTIGRAEPFTFDPRRLGSFSMTTSSQISGRRHSIFRNATTRLCAWRKAASARSHRSSKLVMPISSTSHSLASPRPGGYSLRDA